MRGGPRRGSRERRARKFIADWTARGGSFAFTADGELGMVTANLPKPVPPEAANLILWGWAFPARYRAVARIVPEEGLAG